MQQLNNLTRIEHVKLVSLRTYHNDNQQGMLFTARGKMKNL